MLHTFLFLIFAIAVMQFLQTYGEKKNMLYSNFSKKRLTWKFQEK